MLELEKVRKIAMELRKKGGYWGAFPPAHLMGWLLHEGKCVYCDAPLVDDHHMLSALGGTDHLLPQISYPELLQDPLNLVPACASCSLLKQNWDANTASSPSLYCSGYGEPIDEKSHHEFIARAKEHIATKREERRANLAEDQENWSKALEQLRR